MSRDASETAGPDLQAPDQNAGLALPDGGRATPVADGEQPAVSDFGDTLSFGAEIPFVTHLGFDLQLFEGGESIIDYTPRPEHLNSFAVTHGGAVMTLMDVAMAVAARSVQKEMGVVTIEMKTSFMRATPGDGTRLTAKGRLIHRTATLAFTEATLYNDQAQACAHSTGTFKFVKRLATGTKTANSLRSGVPVKGAEPDQTQISTD